MLLANLTVIIAHLTLCRAYRAAVPWTSGAMYTEEQRLAAQKVFEDREAAEKMRLATLLANESLPLVYLGALCIRNNLLCPKC